MARSYGICPSPTNPEGVKLLFLPSKQKCRFEKKAFVAEKYRRQGLPAPINDKSNFALRRKYK
jgi:hypothetical protein